MNARQEIQEVFRRVFDMPALEIRDDMGAAEIPDWDSLQHINLIVATEKQFSIRFNTSEIAKLKQPDENVGTFVALVERKLAK